MEQCRLTVEMAMERQYCWLRVASAVLCVQTVMNDDVERIEAISGHKKLVQHERVASTVAVWSPGMPHADRVRQSCEYADRKFGECAGGDDSGSSDGDYGVAAEARGIWVDRVLDLLD